MKESLQYRFAREVIAYLQADPLLAEVVESEPFDSEDQVQALNLAANDQKVSVLVSPQGVKKPEDRLNHSSLTVSCAVEILTTKNVQEGTAAALAAKWIDHIAARLLAWPKTIERSTTYEQPVITDIGEAAVSSELPDHQNLIGHYVIIESNQPYKAYYGYTRPAY